MSDEKQRPPRRGDVVGVLAGLCEGFFEGEDVLAGCDPVRAEQLPAGAHELLVHDRHMTGTLTRHFGEAIGLRVLDVRQEGDEYRRKIVLTADSGRRVVEFGIVRMNLAALEGAAREAVLSRRTPLGEVFERHGVLTKVEPLAYLRFRSGSPIVQYFGAGAAEAYGRLGRIHCNGEPAVELLEAVAGEIAD